MTKKQALEQIERIRQLARVTTGTGSEHPIETKWAIVCEVLEALAARNEPVREGDEAHGLIMQYFSCGIEHCMSPAVENSEYGRIIAKMRDYYNRHTSY